MAKNRTCFICGNKYDYCPSCERDKMKPSWYALFCGDVCDSINDILSANTAKKITDKDASKRLKEIDFASKSAEKLWLEAIEYQSDYFTRLLRQLEQSRSLTDIIRTRF